MRTVRVRVAQVAALVVLAAVLLGGCELREGVSSEYGGLGGSHRGTAENATHQEWEPLRGTNFDKWTQIKSE
jgi:hypothetical protein